VKPHKTAFNLYDCVFSVPAFDFFFPFCTLAPQLWTSRAVKKDDESRERIENAVAGNILFSHLDDSDRDTLVDAMAPKTFTPGSTIIKQGDDGDFFYIIDSGDCDVYVAKGNKPAAHVSTIGRGGCFGELALMYNCPRAATIKAKTPVETFTLDPKLEDMFLKSAAPKCMSCCPQCLLTKRSFGFRLFSPAPVLDLSRCRRWSRSVLHTQLTYSMIQYRTVAVSELSLCVQSNACWQPPVVNVCCLVGWEILKGNLQRDKKGNL
jgi:hypothetical protein